MSCSIVSIHYCPVKSLSFQSIKSCNIKKELGMSNDRVFAFSRGIDSEKAKLLEKIPKDRKLNNFLTLKNSPVLNKYNFIYDNDKLVLTHQEQKIISISPNNFQERILLCNKLLELESSLIKPISLLKNELFNFIYKLLPSKIFIISKCEVMYY